MLCLLLGVGCFKGNIATQVGELYGPDDLRRADAFQIFLLAVNIAVIVAPLVCGTLGEKVGWHYGFGAAGVRDGDRPDHLSLGTALAARRGAAGPHRQGGAATSRQRRQRQDRVLVLIMPLLALAAVGNQTIFGSYLLWGEAHYDLVFFGQSMPVTWLVSLDAIISP